jgi:hypothetical protein
LFVYSEAPLKNLPILLATILVGFSTAAAHADTVTLKGSTLRADLFFLNDPSQTNLLTDTKDKIGSGKEFTYNDGIATYSANFTPDSFTIRVNCDPGITLKKCSNEPGFVWEFKDDLFTDSIFTLDPASTLIPAEGFSDPDNLKIIGIIFPIGEPEFGLPSKNSKTIVDVFVTPEASSIVLLGTGMLGIAGTVRRRLFT